MNTKQEHVALHYDIEAMINEIEDVKTRFNDMWWILQEEGL